MAKHQIILAPTEEAGLRTLMTPRTLRVYESSIPGLVTLILFDEDSGYIDAGTRLTTDQVADLYATLGEILSERRAA